MFNIKRWSSVPNSSHANEDWDGENTVKHPIARGHMAWLVVFAMAAECITSCWVPVWFSTATGVNISATALNILGSCLDGMAFGMMQDSSNEGLNTLAKLFRNGFLGVFTSYSYMVEHAGTLLEYKFYYGPMYIIDSLLLSCVAWYFGYIVTRRTCKTLSFSVPNQASYPKFMLFLVTLVVGFLIRAFFGADGFVRDPNDPKFVGHFEVGDGIELILGMLLSSVAILLAEIFGAGDHSVMEWGLWRCNLLSCMLTLLAYGSSLVFPKAVSNIFIYKFVSSFCGSLSGYSATVGLSMEKLVAGSVTSCLLNLLLNSVCGLMFIPYFRY